MKANKLLSGSELSEGERWNEVGTTINGIMIGRKFHTKTRGISALLFGINSEKRSNIFFFLTNVELSSWKKIHCFDKNFFFHPTNGSCKEKGLKTELKAVLLPYFTVSKQPLLLLIFRFYFNVTLEPRVEGVKGGGVRGNSRVSTF